jgi:hypothetical protein
METAVRFADHSERNEVPLINGDEENREKIHRSGAILFASRSDQLQAVSMARAPMDGGLHLHAQRSRRVIYSHVVPRHSKWS